MRYLITVALKLLADFRDFFLTERKCSLLIETLVKHINFIFKLKSYQILFQNKLCMAKWHSLYKAVSSCEKSAFAGSTSQIDEIHTSLNMSVLWSKSITFNTSELC